MWTWQSVEQGYGSTEGRQDYKTSTGITYRGWEQPMDIEKSNENFKNRKLKCFNFNKYRYMAKKCQSKKKERETRRCFKYDKKGYIAKDCKVKQSMHKWNIQEESENEDDKEDKKQGFEEDLE